MKLLRLLPLLPFLGTLSAHAHPGHGLGEHGAAHVMTSPYHLAVLAGTGVALWFAARLVQSQIPRRILQALGVVAVLTAVAIWGSRI